MANTWETIDNTLRGDPYGQMTPEGQSLWDQYQSLLGAQKNAPMANLKLRSGANFPIIEPGFGLKNRMLSKTLGGMTATGAGTRAKAQPGLFAQLAPLFIAAGIKDPAKIKELIEKFTGGTESGGGGDVADASFSSPFEGEDLGGYGEDWWSNMPIDTGIDNISIDDWAGLY